MATKKAAQPTAQEILDGPWDVMVRLLSKLSEKQLKELVELEMKGQNRPNWLHERIYPRYNSVRKAREQRALKKKTWRPQA